MLFEWTPISVKGNSYPHLHHVAKYFFPYNFLFFFVTILIGIQIPSVQPEFLKYTFYMGIIFLGMAHGAADHLFAWGMIKRQNLFKKISLLLIYASFSVLYLIIWKYLPLAALSLFLIITILHWGQGDRYFCLKIYNCLYLKDCCYLKTLNILIKGTLPIFISIYSDFAFSVSFIDSLFDQLGHNLFEIGLLANFYDLYIIIPLSLFIVYILMLFRYCKSSNNYNLKGIIFDISETVLLFLLFLLLPTALSLGIYFILWHSLRHAVRILLADGRFLSGPFKNIPFNISFRWVQLTGAMTILAFIGSSFFLSYNILVPNIDVMWISFTFIAISCLTFPHFITVYLMDKIEID